jgi:Uma2 family endonuclease
MATVTKTRYTPEDLLEINDRPMPELVDGELLEREMGQESDSIALLIGAFLVTFVRTNKLGLVNGSQGSYQVFPDDPDKVRIPDVSFTRRERLSGDGPARGHGRIAPDLAVEVISPNDRAKDVTEKINDFLAAGIPLIWIVYPDSRTVQVFRLDGSAQNLKVGDILDGEDILPGFRLEVAALFEE